MFIIDPREMRAAYNAAQAALARAKSVLANARQDVERYRPLVKREAISKQEYDAATARAAQAAADVESARAPADRAAARESVGEGTSGDGRLALGGRRRLTNKKRADQKET